MKRLVKPLILLIVLVGIVVAVRYTGTDRSRPDADIAFEVPLDPVKVQRVEISRQDAQVTLLNGAEGWSVKTPFGIKPADEQTILSAMKNLSEITGAQLVSHNPEKQSEYRTDETGGSRIRFFTRDDQLAADIIVGKLGGFQQQQMMMGMGGRQGGMNPNDLYTFMRRADSDKVFKVQGFFASITGTDPDQWRERTILSFPASQARKLILASEGRRLVLAPDSTGAWALTDPEWAMADSATIERLLSSLGSLRAEGFQDSSLTDQELGLDSPLHRIRVELAEGAPVELKIGKEFKENYFYARKVGDEQVYTLPGYRVEQIVKDAEELKTGKKPEDRDKDS